MGLCVRTYYSKRFLPGNGTSFKGRKKISPGRSAIGANLTAEMTTVQTSGSPLDQSATGLDLVIFC
jgi:hypothetical protein